ncbi:MAG TPA: amino acid aminotransferase [Casimicrobiaceae bacterium]
MNAPVPASLLSAVEMAPKDPILGVTEAFNADPNPRKVNLGVGVYCNEEGKVPLLECVREAQKALEAKAAPHPYLPIDGIPAYDRAVQELVFGADSAVVQDGRAITVQAIGGTGALKIGADFLRRFLPSAQAYISDPSWENHRALFEGAGFAVNTYPYYDDATHGVDFEAMSRSLEAAPSGSVIVLHACCHNPTGADLDNGQWSRVIEIVRARGHIPILDIAYQGFGEGIAADGAIVGRFAATPGPLFVASSYSKSFSLYGERVGALSVAGSSRDEAARLLSQIKRVARANYSSPPSFGGQVVANVLTTRALRSLWERELEAMRLRIRENRRALVEALRARLPQRDFDFVLDQKGMFSYSGLSADQIQRLRNEFSIYAISTGRICVAALNSRNIGDVADAIATVAQ